MTVRTWDPGMESDSSFRVVIDNPRLLSSCVQLRLCLWPAHWSACLLLCPEDDVICTSFLPVGVLAEALRHGTVLVFRCQTRSHLYDCLPSAALFTVPYGKDHSSGHSSRTFLTLYTELCFCFPHPALAMSK